MKAAMDETSRRRVAPGGVQPASTASRPRASARTSASCSPRSTSTTTRPIPEVEEEPEERYRSLDDLEAEIKALEKQMREAAKALEFEKAAELRDRAAALRAREFGLK